MKTNELHVPISEDHIVLRPNDIVKMAYRHCFPLTDYSYRLRIVGETQVFPEWRCEGGIPRLWYRAIDDALRSDTTLSDNYSLYLAGVKDAYPRNAYIKVGMPGLPPKGCKAELSFWAKTNALKLRKGGGITVNLEIYRQKKGCHPQDVYGLPDEIVSLGIKPGTRDWTQYKKNILMDGRATAVLVKVGASVPFEGEVWLESPRLCLRGMENVIPPFGPDNRFRPELNWLGENLSRKEWPEFQIKLNGKEVFSGAVFNAIYRWPDCEFSLPAKLLKAGKNIIEIKLIGAYPAAPNFAIKMVEILAEKAGDYEVISYPGYVGAKGALPILIQTNKDDLSLEISSDCSRIYVPERRIYFKKKGLHVVRLHAKEAGLGGNIYIASGKKKETLLIKRIVERPEDQIVVSTGDAIFIPQTVEDFRRYLAWYTGNRIGNGICFRPAYRWSGSREVNAGAWKDMVELCNRLGMYYYLMSDGRELSGMRANPPHGLLKGPFYLGRQSHEQDGAFNYWGSASDEELWTEMFHRYKDPDGIDPAVRPVRRNGKFYSYLDPDSASDVREACENFIRNIRFSLKYSTRHTGPSVLFRYFYQAGYDWLGAEQMYCAEDVILSALRGAARAYGKDNYGAHLAVQWSSGPHAEKEHYRRYFLSLALCYLHGVKQINTEEGLWRMEAGRVFEDRFGTACLEHLKVHQRFYRFIQTHSRRGKMRVPIGIIQGNLDGWRCFVGRNLNLWAQNGEQWKYGPAEESYDLLHIFYPRSKLDSTIYSFPCPHKPQGWYTGTPYGHMDIVPIEAKYEALSQYQGLVFLGWNTFKEDHFKELVKYVENGGVLLLSLPHLSTNLKRGLPASIPEKSPFLKRLLGRSFKRGGIHPGKNPHINRLGKGRVIFFNTDCYPADPVIRPAYEEQVVKLASASVASERKRGWVKADNNVNFAAYDRDDGSRDIYLLDINWWQDHVASSAVLLLGNAEFTFAVVPERINVITIKKDWAVFPQNEAVDVMNMVENKDGVWIDMQGDVPCEVLIFHGASGRGSRIIVEVGGKTCHAELLASGLWKTVIPLRGVAQVRVKKL